MKNGNDYRNLQCFVGVLVACMPEGLMFTVSSALLGVTYRLLERGVIVKNADAIDALGSVSCIVMDGDCQTAFAENSIQDTGVAV